MSGTLTSDTVPYPTAVRELAPVCGDARAALIDPGDSVPVIAVGPRRQGADPPPLAARGLGAGPDRRGPVSSRFYPRPAAKARTRPDPADPYTDRAWGRLSPAIAARTAGRVGPAL